MATFEEFITKPVSRKIALLEAEPGLHLSSWTLDSGAIYYSDFSETIINNPAVISQVKENGAALTQRASKTELENVGPGWYQDVSAGKLYVRCSDDGDPNAKVMVAYFKIYFGTEDITFNNDFYQGRIPEDGVSLMAAGEVIDGGEITLLNGDGWFDQRMATWLWRGVRATLLLGGDNLAYADYEKICNLRVQGLGWEDGAVRISLKGSKVDLRKRLPINESYTTEEVLRPNGNGHISEWVASSGNPWDCVNEAQANEDTNYIRMQSHLTKRHYFTLPATSIPDGAVINFVAVYMRSRSEQYYDNQLGLGIYFNGNEYEIDKGRWNKKYKTVMHAWSARPTDGEPWQKSDLNGIEIGVYGVSYSDAFRNTQIYMVINHSVMREFDEGKPMPILLGEGELTPVLENKDYKKGKFRVADFNVQTLKAVEWVKYEDVEIDSQYLEINLPDCWFAIEENWPGTIENPANVRCKVQGAVREDIPGISEDETLITCASDMLRFILGVMGYDQNDLDVQSFNDSKDDAPQECKLFITDLTYVEDVVNWLRQSVRGLFGQNREGKIYFKLWSEDATGALVIDCDREALEFRVLERQGPVCDRAICKYGRDSDTGKWLSTSEGDGNAKHLYTQTETRAFETALANRGDAEAEAYEFLSSHRPPPMECEVVVKLQAAKIEIGDKVKLTRGRAPDGTGSWTEKVFQVRGVQREPENRIRLLLESNLPCLDYQLRGFEDAENPDAREAMQCALAVYDQSIQRVKNDKVLAPSIKKDEALRKDSISTVQIAANSAKAVAHGQTYPVHFAVSMYSSESQNIYELKSFNDLTDFLAGWKIIVFCTGIMPHLEDDGDMEAADTNAWTAMNDALLSKVNSPVHGGNKALKVEIGAGQSYGMARQEIDVTPGPSGSASVFSWRGWARNGNATSVKLIARYYDGAWHYLATDSTSETAEYVELTLLRKSVPAGTTKLIIDLEVEGSAGQYGYFDDVKVSSPDSSVVIKQINGTTKDFKVRAFLEQAGT